MKNTFRKCQNRKVHRGFNRRFWAHRTGRTRLVDPGGLRPLGPEPGVGGFLEFRKNLKCKRGLESKACKSLSRRRFKEIEDAPFAAYRVAYSIGANLRKFVA
jgi:hypothetical protein